MLDLTVNTFVNGKHASLLLAEKKFYGIIPQYVFWNKFLLRPNVSLRTRACHIKDFTSVIGGAA